MRAIGEHHSRFWFLLESARPSRVLGALALFFFPLSAAAFPAPFDITVNGEPQGTWFVEITSDGDFLLAADDLRDRGLPLPATPGVAIDDELYYSLRGDPDYAFELDERTLTLHVEVTPGLLPLTRFDLSSLRPEEVYLPEARSVLLTYGLLASGGTGAPLARVELYHDLAARQGPVLVQTTGAFEHSTLHDRYIRRTSRVIWEDRTHLRRMTAGDLSARSGPLGNTVPLGGVGVSRALEMNPYRVTWPAASVQGVAATPSTVTVYVDGMRVRTEQIGPGPFSLENLARYEGVGEIKVVVRDAYGHEQVLRQPFYMAEQLLAPGEEDFDYALGMIRSDIGITSVGYGDLGAVASHRVGLSDSVTVGYAAEAGPGWAQLGPRLSWKLAEYGYFDVDLAASVGDDDQTGYAGGFEYLYRRRDLNVGFRINGYSWHYTRLVRAGIRDRTMLEAQVFAGVHLDHLGSLTLSHSSEQLHSGTDRHRTMFSYGRRLLRQVQLQLSAGHVEGVVRESSAFALITYTPRLRLQASLRTGVTTNTTDLAVAIQKSTNASEGVGYSASAGLSSVRGVARGTMDSSVQWNSRYAEVLGNASLSVREGFYHASYATSLAGTLSFIGIRPRLSRPIRSSFALVKVGDLKGVRVERNSLVVGRTDKRGEILVPDLAAHYDNQIRIDDEDVPLEYALPRTEDYVSPPEHGGACIAFGASRFQPLIGRLRLEDGAEGTPLEFFPLVVRAADIELHTQTGLGGEFYIDIGEADESQTFFHGCKAFRHIRETTAPDRITVTVEFDKGPSQFELEIPTSDDLFIDFGPVLVSPPSGSGEWIE